MITTTLNNIIREHRPCADGWKKLLGHLNKTEADDDELPFSVIVKSNDLDDAIWCCCAAPEYDKEWRLYAVWCARQVQHLMKDSRSIKALDVAERFANGLATKEELDLAWNASGDAAGAVWLPARTAWAAAGNVAGVAAKTAARTAAFAAGDAAWVAAKTAARTAARTTAMTAAKWNQTNEFLRIVGGKNET